MNAWHRGVWTLLGVLAIVVAATLATAWFAFPLEGINVTVDGTTYSLVDVMQGPRGVVVFLVAVLAVVFAIVVALSMIVVGLGFGALGLAVGALTALASMVIVAAPFALIAWLLWRHFHPRPAGVATGR